MENLSQGSNWDWNGNYLGEFQNGLFEELMASLNKQLNYEFRKISAYKKCNKISIYYENICYQYPLNPFLRKSNSVSDILLFCC